ncbi:NAD(P)-binding protein [Mycena filopes]|nr:NAD(P)-binding protein [Mycena filopes]
MARGFLSLKPRQARRPRLVGILATSSAPSKFYAEFTRKQCEDLGVDFVLKTTAIIQANEDENIDGIMQDHYLQQVVSPYKDVEGLHFKFHYNLYHNIRFIEPKSLISSGVPSAASAGVVESEEPPPGTVKSIIPCTPLAIVKCLEHVGVYNKILPYGDRAYGRTITVINRSEVVGRPLAALLANDGARVFSVDIDSVQEYTKRPGVAAARRYHPRHVVHPSTNTLQDCLAISDVVVSAVPTASWLKDGCNFEKDVRDKASLYIPAVGKVTICMLIRTSEDFNQIALAGIQDD